MKVYMKIPFSLILLPNLILGLYPWQYKVNCEVYGRRGQDYDAYCKDIRR